MQDMRFGVIREKTAASEQVYTLDEKRCPECHWPTEIGDDPLRRYCTNKKCNAFILEETHEN
jgi:hypothetical protein